LTAARRVVITGVGLVSPLGIGTEPTWQGLLEGRSGMGPITLFDASHHSTHFAAEVKGFDPLQWVEKKDVKKMDRFIQFAVAAGDLAVKDAKLPLAGAAGERVGVYVGSGIGGFATIEREHEALMKGGPRRISPFFIPSAIANLASGWVSIRTGAKGPNSCTCTACTSGAHALGDSFRLIQRGDADAMIAGGSEAAITPLGVGGFCSMRALSTRNDAPEKASRPFDKDRDGFVMGEGAGLLVLEELEQAKARGARIYCEVVGYGMSGDAFHITSPCEDGDGAIRVMRAALKDAGLEASDIDYVNTHGTSTPVGDAMEVVAIKAVFGAHAQTKLAISSTKSMTGHLLGAAGGVEAGISALALRDQVLPPTINLENLDPACDLDCVPNVKRAAKVRYALSNSFGFGGTNGALIFKRYEATPS
jgi:3-oxoacyl-[acyl-carrier-protein] synthase II